MEWLTRPYPEDEVPHIDSLIAVFTGGEKDDGKLDPSIKSWANKVGVLNDLLKNRYNLKWILVFCTYRWPNGLKGFSSGSTHKDWKYYQEIIHNTYHGGNIETDHLVICLMLEDTTKHFIFPNFTTLVSVMLREVLENNTTTRDKSYPNGLDMTKGESGGVYMMLKTKK